MILPYFFTSVVQDVAIYRDDGTVIEGTVSSISYFDGGVIMYPLTFCALVVLALSARAAWKIWGSGFSGVADSPGGAVTSRLHVDGILFWGAMALVLGILGTTVGIAVAAQSVEAVGVVETSLVWGGIRVALLPTIVGLVYFVVAALLWFGLRYAHLRRILAEAAA